MEDLHCLRSVRSNPALTSMYIAQRQMSASTPPTLNNETRLPLPDECYIPLPPSPDLAAQHEDEGYPAQKTEENPASILPIPLLELLHAIQEDNYESRRLVSLQDEAFGLFHKCGSCDRFLTVQAQLYRSMMDCFRNDKKSAFASLYTKAMSYPTFGELRIKGPTIDDELDDSSGLPWTDRLPPESRLAVMDFLFRLRSDPEFVADRISRLSSNQLKRLIRLHGPLETGPIFRSRQTQGIYDVRSGQRGLGKSNESEISVEDLLSDPLLLMIHGVFDQNNSERTQQVNIWSSVCAKLVEEAKPGSDEFCITVLNIFVGVPEWTALPKLELLLSELISNGGSVLDVGGQDPKLTLPQERSSNSHPLSFLDHYVPRLLDILCDNPAPPQALDLIHVILTKISDPNRRLAARNFFFLRWYCASFLANAITYPENHGILLEHHINNSIRQKILRELASRLQNNFSIFLSSGTMANTSNVIFSKIRNILSVFEHNGPSGFRDAVHNSTSRCFLFLRSDDVLAMARALTPLNSPESKATSVFELAQTPPASILAYQSQFIPSFVDQYSYHIPSDVSGNQSNSSHASSPMMDSGYNSMDKGAPRPRPTDNALTDSEKYGAMPFIHDLWTLNASREYTSTTAIKHEVAVIFVGEDGHRLSLEPFKGRVEPLIMDQVPLQQLGPDNQRSLTAAIMQLTDQIADLGHNYHGISLTSLDGLITLFRDQASHCNNSFDYQGEYFWWKCLGILNTAAQNVLANFVTFFMRQKQDKVSRRREMAKEYEDWLHALRARSNIQDQKNQRLSLSSKRLRNKMWFVSDVRHSSAYEEAYNVVRALRTMVEPTSQKQSGVTGWAKQRFRSSFGQERALTQLLELMTAPKPYGGPNKLSENQVEITSGWLLHENIENFCKGEERIHRFCYEIQKCIKRLAGEAMLDSPVLWSSPLYANEKIDYGVTSQTTSRHQQPDRSSRRMDFPLQQWPNGQTIPGPLSFPGPENLASASSPTRQLFEHNSQTGNPGKILGLPQGSRNWMLPPSPISPGNVKTSYNGATLQRRSFLQNLRIHLTSLLLSDLGSVLWKNGSETDHWISSLERPKQPSTVREQTSFNGHSELTDSAAQFQCDPASKDFNFREAYKVLLHRFCLTSNPQNKLRYLHELLVLVSYDKKPNSSEQYSPTTLDQADHDHSRLDRGLGLGVPRTRLTRLQEVAANCEDRRRSSVSNSISDLCFDGKTKQLPKPYFDDPDLIAAVQNIFEDPAYRPMNFFRDLQYIAAFVPASILDHTPQGTAFWTIGLAAIRIKSEKCKIMTDNAMQILDFHYSNGNKKEPVRNGQISPLQTSSRTTKLTHQNLLSTTLRDAAQLLTTSALEGDPTAARELALFYLTHPELVSRVTLPLSRPSDVFRVKHGLASERGNRGNGNEESGILDSVTFAVVFHWMEFAASAGDADAITFFKENKDLGTAL